MSKKQSLQQIQSQKQKLSHTSIMLYKMMELNLMQFNDRIQEELELNPALENLDNVQEEPMQTNDIEVDNSLFDTTSEDYPNDELIDNINSDILTIDYEQEINDQSNTEDSLSEFKIKENYQEYDYNKDEEEREIFIPIEDHNTLVSNLNNQLQFNNLNQTEIKIGEFIIGDLDDDGYLRRSIDNIVDDLSFRLNIEATHQEVEHILELIQDLDPPGIGARNLQECLIIQLNKKENSKINQLALEIVTNYFVEFAKKNYSKIFKKLNINELQFIEIQKLISTLNPKPTNDLTKENEIGKYINPDFYIFRNDKKLELELHSYNQPNLSISEDFVDMLKRNKELKKRNKEEQKVNEFLTERIKAATTFMSVIKERQETMVIIMKKIMEKQYDFFMSGNEIDIKPLALKNIAEETFFDISTISRSTSNKYVQTEFGIFSLKFFFSDSMIDEAGDEISTRKIIKILESIIEHEDKKKPYSDEELTNMLFSKGIKIARRTTAKYREILNIPPRFNRRIST